MGNEIPGEAAMKMALAPITQLTTQQKLHVAAGWTILAAIGIAFFKLGKRSGRKTLR
jgi:hypothetical protein